MNINTAARPNAPLSNAPLAHGPLAKGLLAQTLLPRSTPRAAFGRTVRNEARLAWRQPAGLIFGIGVPLLLLIIFGELPSFHQPQASLGGLALFPVYVPVILTFVIAILGLIALPAPLVSHRDLGILRRIGTTPMPPAWVLAAQHVAAASGDAGRAPGHQLLHPARGGGGSGPGLDAGTVPAGGAAAGAGRVRRDLLLPGPALLPLGMRSSNPRTQEDQ